jgi:osmotically-inducible protein OsmY
MNTNTSFARSMAAALLATAAALTVLPGCAVTRGQSTVGEYIDDASVTTAVKAKFVESKAVDAVAINVETLNGTVMLSGFAKSLNEGRGRAPGLERQGREGRAQRTGRAPVAGHR